MVACHACMDELKWHIDGHEKQILKGNQKKLPSLCLHTLPPHPTCPKIWYAPHDFRPKEKRHHCWPHLYLLRGFLWVPLTPFSFLFFTPCLFPLSLSHTYPFILFIHFFCPCPTFNNEKWCLDHTRNFNWHPERDRNKRDINDIWVMWQQEIDKRKRKIRWVLKIKRCLKIRTL